jgi:hypothetical protein
MAATVVGDQAVGFGMTDNSGGLHVTTSVGVTLKRDKKELRGNTGDIIAVAYFNPTSDISIEGYGETEAEIGGSVTLGVGFDAQAANIIVEEITYTATNEDFIKSSVKATGYNFA